MIGIYKVTNLIDGRVYVGSTKNSVVRKEMHFKDSIIKMRREYPLYHDMIKFGKENFRFEMLEECNAEELGVKEAEYIKRYNSVETGYNTVSTQHPMHDTKFRKDNSKRLSEMNRKNWAKEDYRKRKSRESSELQKERLKDPAYLAEKSKQLKKYTDSIKKPIGQYDKQGNLIATYDGMREASRATGINSNTISEVARGVKYRKTAGGYVWKYL